MRLVRNFKIYAAFTVPAISVIIGAIYVMATVIHSNHSELAKIRENQTKEAQFLMSIPSFETERQRLTLYVRDVIKEKWDSIYYRAGTYDRAYDIASVIMEEAVKYPYAPAHETALFSAAVLSQESAFLDTLVSVVGAKGMPQFMPSTARTIFRIVGMEYQDSLLQNYRVSIRMQAVLLDILHATYGGDRQLMLADYHGGPWQVYYYKTKSPKLDPVTTKYVPEVMGRYKKYLDTYKTYKAKLGHQMEAL